MKVRACGLLSGLGTGVIRWPQHVAEQSERSAATRIRLEQTRGYFDRHRDRIHYDRYLAAGCPMASGVIEGACRHVVKDRMERGRHALDSARRPGPAEPALRVPPRVTGTTS